MGSRRRVLAASLFIAACGRSHGVAEYDWADAGGFVTATDVAPVGVARAGMVFVSSGVLRAGSDLDDVPRVADAELPGVAVALTGFYIDELPWPNESGAIPTTDVTRGEAQGLCESKGKRLCSELEWERACKGPDNTRFEYAGAYDPSACQAGVSLEASVQRPSGQRANCKSAWGVLDMHGGATEWTSSAWGRGSAKDLGVLRGGNDLDGELATRCAYARALSPDERVSTSGFRCCLGPRSSAVVELDVSHGIPFEGAPNASQASPALDVLGGVSCGPPRRPAPCSVSRAWSWRPFPNVDLAVSGGCTGRDPSSRCALAISRALGDRVQTLAQIDTGAQIPEVVLVESKDNRIRIRGADARGQYFREASFRYGRVDVRVVH